MRVIRLAKAIAMTGAILGIVSCGGTDRAATDSSTAAPNGTPAARADQPANSADRSAQSIALNGCLQRGDGRNSFVLTRVNEPRQSVGTSGEAQPGTVAREQARAAENAYSLNPQGDLKLDDLVGKQVQVTGMMARKADIPTAGDTGRPDDRNSPSSIKERDLARLDVMTATATADACGGSEKESPKPTRPSDR
jgi:hypothetical protein